MGSKGIIMDTQLQSTQFLLYKAENGKIKVDVLIQDEKKDYTLLPVILDMPTRYKNVLYLYYYEGYKIDEIAGILKMNINTVKSRLKRGREILKKKVGEDDE